MGRSGGRQILPLHEALTGAPGGIQLVAGGRLGSGQPLISLMILFLL